LGDVALLDKKLNAAHWCACALQDIHWGKIRFMAQKFGLQPWYKLVNRRRRVEDEAGVPLVAVSEVVAPAAVAAADADAVQPAAVQPTATAIEP
jgi:hypothetical protein